MDITTIKNYADISVLAWLATVDANNVPNVSPKELFIIHNKVMYMANISSPQSVKNIVATQKASLAFIDVLSQKGCQIKGAAWILSKNEAVYAEVKEAIIKRYGGLFEFSEIIAISIEESSEILAPRYRFYPETTEEEQIERSKKQYGFI